VRRGKKAFTTTVSGHGFLSRSFGIYQPQRATAFLMAGRGCSEPVALYAIWVSVTLVAFDSSAQRMGQDSGQFRSRLVADARKGPTSVRPLIPCRDMVAAGVFWSRRRLSDIIRPRDHGVTPSLPFVVWSGVITGLMAGLIRDAQFDLQRFLPTPRLPVGLMMVSLGAAGSQAGDSCPCLRRIL